MAKGKGTGKNEAKSGVQGLLARHVDGISDFSRLVFSAIDELGHELAEHCDDDIECTRRLAVLAYGSHDPVRRTAAFMYLGLVSYLLDSGAIEADPGTVVLFLSTVKEAIVNADAEAFETAQRMSI